MAHEIRPAQKIQVEIANFLEQKAGGIVEAFEHLREIAPGAVPKVLPPVTPDAPKPPPPKLQAGEEPWRCGGEMERNGGKPSGKLMRKLGKIWKLWEILGQLMKQPGKIDEKTLGKWREKPGNMWNRIWKDVILWACLKMGCLQYPSQMAVLWKTGGTWWESTGKAMLCLLVIKLKNSWNLKHGKDRDEWPLQTWENAIKNTCTNHYKSMGWLGISNFATWHPLEHHVATNCADRLRDVHDYYEECADEVLKSKHHWNHWNHWFWPLAGGSLRAELFASSSATQGEWKRGLPSVGNF